MYQRLGQQELADRDFTAFRYNRKAKELGVESEPLRDVPRPPVALRL